ncbi:hypothetical protein BD626DRAFT_406757, partial [Schizophyllum amplum]
MLVSALEHRAAIEKLYKDDSVLPEIEALEMSRVEWKCAEQLCTALKDATEYFSRASSPNLPFVIIAMDELDQCVATMSIQPDIEPAIRAAAALAKRTLNRYYSLTDQADAYRISMVLHPRHKLEYFKNIGWSDAWIADAEAVTRSVYNDNY